MKQAKKKRKNLPTKCLLIWANPALEKLHASHVIFVRVWSSRSVEEVILLSMLFKVRFMCIIYLSDLVCLDILLLCCVGFQGYDFNGDRPWNHRCLDVLAPKFTRSMICICRGMASAGMAPWVYILCNIGIGIHVKMYLKLQSSIRNFFLILWIFDSFK